MTEFSVSIPATGWLGPTARRIALLAAVLAAFMVALSFGNPALLVSVALAAFPLLAAMIWLGRGMVLGNRGPMMVAVVVVALGLSLGFRIKEAGDTGLDWQNGAKLAVWCAFAGVGLVRWRTLWPMIARPSMLMIGFAVALAMLSALWSPVPFYTFACGLGLFAYLMVAGLVSVDLSRADMLKAIRVSLLAFVLLGLATAVLAPDLAWQPPSVEETAWRFQGLGGNPNGFGHLVGFFLAVCFVSWISGVISGRTLAFDVAVAAGPLLLSGDRTILIALILAGGLVWLRGRAWGWLVAIFLLGASALVMALFALGMGPEFAGVMRHLSRTGSESEILTLTGRTDLWQAAFDRFLERPLFGWGFNGTEEVMASSMPKSFPGAAVNAHNMYLQQAMSLGLFGLLPLLAMVVRLLHAFVTRPEPIRDLLALVVLINGLAEADIFATPVLTALVLFWLMIADDAALARTGVGRAAQ